MALSGPTLGGIIKGLMTNPNGTKATTFTTAIGNGIVAAILAENSFQLAGHGSDSGGGTGNGITGFNVSAGVSAMLALMGVIHTPLGSNSNDFVNAVMNGTNTHIASAVLSSSSASGTVTAGSYAVSAGTVSSQCKTFLQADGAHGTSLQNLCDAIGAGVRAGFNTASGNVSGTSPAGSGTVS